MIGERLVPRGGEAVDIAHLVERMYSRREVGFQQCFSLVGQEAAHHKDTDSVDSAGAQLNAFVHGTDCQPARTLGTQNTRHLERSVSIGIGLHYAGDFHIGAHYLLYILEIARDLLPRHQDIGSKGSGHYLIVRWGGFAAL